MNNPEVHFVNHGEIDRAKWARRVAASSVPLVYAEPEYLDLVAPHWDALVCGDYDHVMPLSVSRKIGLSFLLQPLFAQQHGIFPEAGQLVQDIFLKAVYNRFSYVAIHLNASHSGSFPEVFSVGRRNNFILDLAPGYEDLVGNYSKHTRRQIKKAESEMVSVVKGLPVNEYIDLKNGATENKLPQQSMQTLRQLISYGYSSGKGILYAAYNRDNLLCAAAFFLQSGGRAVYLNAVSTPEGKSTNAMHLIVDQFIKEHSGQKLTLDFEGSTIQGIARFYQGFGAVCEQYFTLKSNRLPIPLRWFIK